MIFGFLTRPCCSLPFFGAIFGVSVSSMLNVVEEYRYLLFVVSFIIFSVAGYFTFRIKGGIFNKVFFVGSVLITAVFIWYPDLFF